MIKCYTQGSSNIIIETYLFQFVVIINFHFLILESFHQVLIDLKILSCTLLEKTIHQLLTNILNQIHHLYSKIK